MKPVNFENGELLGKKDKPVELKKGQRLVIIDRDELRTAALGLETAARAEREAASNPRMPSYSSSRLREYAHNFDELAEGFRDLQ